VDSWVIMSTCLSANRWGKFSHFAEYVSTEL
jgi:hypothetical protein